MYLHLPVSSCSTYLHHVYPYLHHLHLTYIRSLLSGQKHSAINWCAQSLSRFAPAATGASPCSFSTPEPCAWPTGNRKDRVDRRWMLKRRVLWKETGTVQQLGFIEAIYSDLGDSSLLALPNLFCYSVNHCFPMLSLKIATNWRRGRITSSSFSHKSMQNLYSHPIIKKKHVADPISILFICIYI